MDSGNRVLYNKWEWVPREAEICGLELLKYNSAVFCLDVWEKNERELFSHLNGALWRHQNGATKL